MRDKFLGYHKPIKEELNKMWQEGTFVFDTSVLLNIYRYTPATREDFFKILEHIKDSIWLPYQVGLEYHEQRENVIVQQNAIYDDIEQINKVFQENVLNKYKKGHPFANTKKIEQIIKKAVEESKGVLKETQSKLPDLLEDDPHLENLKNLFDKKVGDQYSKEDLHKIYAEAQERYKENSPPGYKDAKNKDGSNAYGDVVLWYQILNYATEHKAPMILVIDDAKEDWWRKDRDKKILGPRPELIQEFHEKTGNLLYMYLADEFIKQAQQKLNIQIQPATIKEAREIRQAYQTEPKEIMPTYKYTSQDLENIESSIRNRQATLLLLLNESKSLENYYTALKDKDDATSIKNIEAAKERIGTNMAKYRHLEHHLRDLERKRQEMMHEHKMFMQDEMIHTRERALQEEIMRMRERIAQLEIARTWEMAIEDGKDQINERALFLPNTEEALQKIERLENS